MKTTVEKIKNIIRSTSMYILVTAVLLMPTRKGKNPDEETIRSDQFIGEPGINIMVNRKYNEKGNVVKFDSTYSSLLRDNPGYAHDPDGPISTFEHNYLQREVSPLIKKFRYVFRTDSVFKEDFFRSDFFLKRYELNDAYLRKVMHEMDSIKNKFYWEYQYEKPHDEGRGLR